MREEFIVSNYTYNCLQDRQLSLIDYKLNSDAEYLHRAVTVIVITGRDCWNCNSAVKRKQQTVFDSTMSRLIIADPMKFTQLSSALSLYSIGELSHNDDVSL